MPYCITLRSRTDARITGLYATPDEIGRDLMAAGFQIVFVRDHGAALAGGLPAVIKQLETEGLPPLGRT
jgi:hypothetical protein